MVSDELKNKLIKEKEGVYVFPKIDDMKTTARLFLNDKLMENLEDEAILQAKNVACMPGIVGHFATMSDMHMGYGFPIGGVAAFDAKEGCITPGGIGFDINCGVRLIASNLTYDDVKDNMENLVDRLFKHVPSGVGSESNIRLDPQELDEVLNTGAKWAVKNGYGTEEDLYFCEEEGGLDAADASKVSRRSKARGRKQLGTLGAGNHFVEVQVVDEIMDSSTAEAFGLKENQIVVMIHCGSRGLGHQVCSDYLREMEDEYSDVIAKLPEKDLAYAPINSRIAKDYYAAMCAAANFAWCNRHVIATQVRDAFKELYPESELRTVYDVAHNIAKLETHEIDGEQKEVYVHRKGATRAFPKGSLEIPEKYKEFGQPVLIPGSMGTFSYVLVGTELALKESFGSSSHGAGRVMSRSQAKRTFNANTVKSELKERKIFVKSASFNGISEEAPGVYKDIDEVINTVTSVGLANVIVRLRPVGVIKG